MKKLLLTMLLFMLLVPCSAVAVTSGTSHGSAVTTTIDYRYKNSTRFDLVEINLSNITNVDVTCTVRFYDHNGNEIIEEILQNVYTGNDYAYNEVIASTEPIFNIPAHQSRSLHLYNTSPRMVYGYAIIEWESQDPSLGKALVGTVMHKGVLNDSTATTGASMPINGGQPF